MSDYDVSWGGEEVMCITYEDSGSLPKSILVDARGGKGLVRYVPEDPSPQKIQSPDLHLYIIGPVTGCKDDNRPAFGKASRSLADNGYFVTTPHMLINPGEKWHKAMRRSFMFIINHAEGIAMLDGWENSKGATIECEFATACGIPCKPWREWLDFS